MSASWAFIIARLAAVSDWAAVTRSARAYYLADPPLVERLKRLGYEAG